MTISERQTAIYNKLIESYTGPWIGVRHIFAFLGFLGFVNVYAMRVNLSVAIVAMVNDTSSSNSTNNTGNYSINYLNSIQNNQNCFNNVRIVYWKHALKWEEGAWKIVLVLL